MSIYARLAPVRRTFIRYKLRFRPVGTYGPLRPKMIATMAALLALGGPSGFAVVHAGPVPIVNTINLGATGTPTMAVDSGRSHVFVAAPTQNAVLVLSYDAMLITTIPNESGAGGLLIDDLNAVLYVAQSSSGKIDRVSLESLASIGALTDGLSRPSSLVIAAGKLWVREANATYGYGTLASVDLDTGSVTHFLDMGFAGQIMATSPALPSTLFIATGGFSPDSVYRVNVESGSPVVVASNLFTEHSNIKDLAVSPDGTRLLAAGPPCCSPLGIHEMNTDTLKSDGIYYPASGSPSALAVTSAYGGRFAMGLDNALGPPDILIFRIGEPIVVLALNTFNNPNAFSNVFPHGLAFDDVGQHLFVLTGNTPFTTTTSFFAFSLPCGG